MSQVDTKKKPRKLKANAVSDNQIDDLWMTVGEVAQYLSMKERQIRSLVFGKKIPHCKVGRLVRFHRPTIDAWMLSHSK